MKPFAMIVSTVERHGNGEPLFWSNTDGWVHHDNADWFSINEMGTLSLPDTGKWMIFSR